MSKKVECPAVGEGEFRLIVPRYDNDGNRVQQEKYDKYVEEMNKHFGGSSSWRIGGCYLDDEKKQQCEGNVVISGIRDFDSPYSKLQGLSCDKREKTLQEDKNFVKNLSRMARKDFGQESVLSVFDRIGDATFVKGKKKESPLTPEIKQKKERVQKEIFQEIF